MQDYLFDEDDNTEAMQGIGSNKETMETSDIAEGDNLIYFE